MSQKIKNDPIIENWIRESSLLIIFWSKFSVTFFLIMIWLIMTWNTWLEDHKREIWPPFTSKPLKGRPTSTRGPHSSYVVNFNARISTLNIVAVMSLTQKFRSNLRSDDMFVLAGVMLMDHEHPGLLFVAIIN